MNDTKLMNAQSIDTACVLGAGTMGHGITHVLAAAGISVRLFDVAQDAVDGGLAKIRANLDKGIARGKVDESQRDAALERISGSTDLGAAADGVQVVIEAVPERMELKRSLFQELGAQLGPDVLLATNTSRSLRSTTTLGSNPALRSRPSQVSRGKSPQTCRS